MARAHEHGLPVSKPWGEMRSYDFVIGKTGRFVSVQVKSTISRWEAGYVCTVRGGHKPYPAGSFDFVAVYLVFEDTWYIIPAELIRGKGSVTLFPKSPHAKYEPYREAWHLLREASELREAAESGAAESGAAESDAVETRAAEAGAAESVERHPTGALGRLEQAMSYFERQLDRGGHPPKR